jgi:hypothetical protein
METQINTLLSFINKVQDDLVNSNTKEAAEAYGTAIHNLHTFLKENPTFQGAEEVVEEGRIHPIFEDIFGSLGAILAPLTIAASKEPEQHSYSISIQFTTNRKLTPQEADSILDACIIQVQDPYNNEGQQMDVTIVDYNAEIQ